MAKQLHNIISKIYNWHLVNYQKR